MTVKDGVSRIRVGTSGIERVGGLEGRKPISSFLADLGHDCGCLFLDQRSDYILSVCGCLCIQGGVEHRSGVACSVHVVLKDYVALGLDSAGESGCLRCCGGCCGGGNRSAYAIGHA